MTPLHILENRCWRCMQYVSSALKMAFECSSWFDLNKEATILLFNSKVMKELIFKTSLTCIWRYNFSVVSACCSQNRQTAHTGCSSQSDQSLMIKNQKDSFNCGKEKRHFVKGHFRFCTHSTRTKPRETEIFEGVEETLWIYSWIHDQNLVYSLKKLQIQE